MNNAEPYLIAEIGMNHEGDLSTAKQMIREVAKAGWDAAKFQTYQAETLAARDHSKAYWDVSQEHETSQFRLFDRLGKFSLAQYGELEALCTDLGIDFLTTAFDENSMKHFGNRMRFIKIASADITNVPLLRLAAEFGRPILLSCGAASLDEVDRALQILSASGAGKVTLLHCVLNYPTDDSNAHLKGILELKEAFPDHEVGYSDHTRYSPECRPFAPTVAVILGASVIEKHFTLDRTLTGNDHYHSADPFGLAAMREEIVRSIELLGSGIDLALETQIQARQNARRRIFAKRNLAKGAVITSEDVLPLRADTGLEVAEWDTVIGAVLLHDIRKDHPLLAEYVSR